MMNMRIYKIDTGLTDSENKELVKNITEQDAFFLSSLDIKVSVDLLDENDKLTTIMVTNIINLEKLKTYLIKSNLDYQIEDITEHFTSEQNPEKISEIVDNLTTDDILKSLGVEI